MSFFDSRRRFYLWISISGFSAVYKPSGDAAAFSLSKVEKVKKFFCFRKV